MAREVGVGGSALALAADGALASQADEAAAHDAVRRLLEAHFGAATGELAEAGGALELTVSGQRVLVRGAAVECDDAEVRCARLASCMYAADHR